MPTFPPRPEFVMGDWLATCSMCGRERKASQLVKNWQGMWRCPEHNEPRHPQEYVRAVPDIQTPPWTQPEPDDTFAGVCFPDDQTSIVDYAVVDCVIIDFISPFATPVPITQVVFLLSGMTWTVPVDWNDNNNTVECIGAGGGGMASASGGGGGGGGAYSKSTNLTLTGTVLFGVGIGGTAGSPGVSGGNTYFNGANFASAQVAAQGGFGGGTNPPNTFGIGGQASAGAGFVRYNGGAGGNLQGVLNSGGGGGSGGPLGNGANGGNGSPTDNSGGGGGAANGGTAGSQGGYNSGGAGGVFEGGRGGSGSNSGDPGKSNTCFDYYHGVGGGGGGAGQAGVGTVGGFGGAYGGGGGGGVLGSGRGADGLIVITYTPD